MRAFNQLMMFKAASGPGPGPGPVDNGVYIKYTDGSVSPYDTLVSGKTPVGVAVITDNVRIVLHPDETMLPWNRDRTGIRVDGCFTTTDTNTAKADYAGRTNTDAIIAALGSDVGQAANWAKNVAAFADGSIGWLPSCGETVEIHNNKDAVNTALGLIGGLKLHDYYWTSTQFDGSRAWVWLYGYDAWGCIRKDDDCFVRSVCAF